MLIYHQGNENQLILLNISSPSVPMVSRSRVRIPAVSTLIAFESAGRLGNFSRAAEELQTSQSAISRHIARLEQQLSTRVFDRSRTGVRLTEAGSHLYDAVARGLQTIDRAIVEAGEASNDEHVAIACSHDAWQLVFMPRLDVLRRALGENSAIRFLLHSHESRDPPRPADADVVFAWDGKSAGPESLAVKEAVRPVCSPQYAMANAATLEGSVDGWGELTLLDFSLPDQGWASWDDWFDTVGRPDALPRILKFESYSDVLQATSAGKGIALGWQCCVAPYIETHTLVPLGDGFVEFDNFYCGLLTEKGRRKPVARNCLATIGEYISS